MKKQQLISDWKNALSNFQQESFNTSSLNSIDSFEIENDTAVIKVGSNLFECSLEDLAKETGRNLEYIKIEFRNYSDDEVHEFLEHSFFNQNNIELFFSQLTDAVISMKRIFLIDQSAVEWVEELQAQYIKNWVLSPAIQNAPFPTMEDEFPNLDNYGLSFMASY